MNHCDPAELRESYDGMPLCHADLAAHPMQQFHIWFTQAHTSDLAEPNAMVVATVGPGEAPRARTVLLKGYDPSGLCFFTNYGSPKGRALAENSQVSAVFPWHPVRRQVVVCGIARRLSDEENDAYFHTRPRGSRIAAWVSQHQSSPVASRTELDELYEYYSGYWPEGSYIPRPPYWGGYRVFPNEVEFWQGRENRMHDRFRYLLAAGTSAEGTWNIDRLSP